MQLVLVCCSISLRDLEHVLIFNKPWMSFLTDIKKNNTIISLKNDGCFRWFYSKMLFYGWREGKCVLCRCWLLSSSSDDISLRMHTEECLWTSLNWVHELYIETFTTTCLISITEFGPSNKITVGIELTQPFAMSKAHCPVTKISAFLSAAVSFSSGSYDISFFSSY